MKIAVWHNLQSGGAKRALYHHVRGLVQRGHEVEAWCPETADKNYLPLTDFIKENRCAMTLRAENFAEIFLSRFAGNENLSQTKRRLEALDRHCRECARQINEKKFDILFAQSSVFLGTAPIARYVSGPKVLYLQEPFRAHHENSWAYPKDLSFRNKFNDFSFAFWRRKAIAEEIQNAKAFDKILVNSFYSRESVARAYQLESTVCYLGVDTDLFEPTGEAKGNFLVGLGRLDTLKGADRVIKALAKVDSKIRPKLLWLGDGLNSNYGEGLKKMAEEAGVRLEIKILIEDRELISLLSRAKMMVCAPRLEPFGLAPLEANACGTPVVALAEGGLRETVVDGINGILVPDADPELMGGRIEMLLKNENQIRSMEKSAREYAVKNWEWKIAVDRLEILLLKAAKINHAN